MQDEKDRHSRLKKVGRSLVRWLPALLWMGLIFYLSAQPDLPHHPEDIVDLVIKKAGHMAEYGILAGLVWWAWPRSDERGRQRVFSSTFILSGLYAISDEVHQFFVPGRNGQLLDVGFDLLGAVLALLFISNLVDRREPQRLR